MYQSYSSRLPRGIILGIFAVLAAQASAFPDAYTTPALTVLGGAEYKSRTSYHNNSGSTASASKHVFLTNIRFTGGKWSDQHPTDAGGFFYTASTTLRGSTLIQGTLGANISYGGNNYSYFSSANGSYLDTASVDDVRAMHATNTLYVVTPGEMGVTGTPATVAVTQGGSTQLALSKSVSDMDDIPLHLASTGALAADDFVVLIKAERSWHRLVGWTNVYQGSSYQFTAYFWEPLSETKWHKYTYDIRKLLCEDSAIDARRMHGVANTAGGLPGMDPNAPLQEQDFSGWLFKGGLFVGQMLTSSGDLSRMARTQLYPQGGGIASNSKLSVLSLLYTGKPSTATGAMDIKAYIPDSGDQSGVGHAAVRWSTRWDKDLATACETITFNNDTPLNDYVNFKMSYTGTVATPRAFLMAVLEEGSSFQAWRYFASKEYAAEHVAKYPTLFPQIDSQPRLWVVDETYSSWLQ